MEMQVCGSRRHQRSSARMHIVGMDVLTRYKFVLKHQNQLVPRMDAQSGSLNRVFGNVAVLPQSIIVNSALEEEIYLERAIRTSEIGRLLNEAASLRPGTLLRQ